MVWPTAAQPPGGDARALIAATDACIGERQCVAAPKGCRGARGAHALPDRDHDALGTPHSDALDTCALCHVIFTPGSSGARRVRGKRAAIWRASCRPVARPRFRRALLTLTSAWQAASALPSADRRPAHAPRRHARSTLSDERMRRASRPRRGCCSASWVRIRHAVAPASVAALRWCHSTPPSPLRRSRPRRAAALRAAAAADAEHGADDTAAALALARSARSLVIFTGSGVSASAGMSTFSDPGAFTARERSVCGDRAR